VLYFHIQLSKGQFAKSDPLHDFYYQRWYLEEERGFACRKNKILIIVGIVTLFCVA
jgi:hypothetical protein